MTLSNEEAERISDQIRRELGIDVTNYETEEELRDVLERLFESDRVYDPEKGKEVERNKLANLRKVKDIIIDRFVEEWKEKRRPSEEEMIVEIARRIRTIRQLQEALERGELSEEQAERLRPYIEKIEAGEEIEIGKDVTAAEIIGRKDISKKEVGEVPTIALPKEEKAKAPEYPPQTFTERERRLIQEINQKVVERTSPQRITGTVQRTVVGVRDAVVNVGTRVIDTVKDVVDWVRRRLGGR